MPFFAPDGQDQVHALDALVAMADRVALDSTGLGIPIYEFFNTKYPGKIMGINFAGSVKRAEQGDKSAERGLASSVKIKTDMAVRMKRRMEQRLNRIPRNADIRQELQAIKREQGLGGAITFDAPRIEVETPGGVGKKKSYSHAEAFWAKAMADLAATNNIEAVSIGVDDQGAERPRHQSMFNVNPARPAKNDSAPTERKRRSSVWNP
jgi:phage FluMu gp28-like protein